MLLLIISLVLAVVPWFGVAWILFSGTVTTVDGLFMSLILATMSAIFAFSAYIEFPRARRAAAIRAQAGFDTGALIATAAGGALIRGIVRSVEFFEAHVGQPNKSLVTLANSKGVLRMLVLQGDLRNRLPAGKNVSLVYREDNGYKMLVSAEHS